MRKSALFPFMLCLLWLACSVAFSAETAKAGIDQGPLTISGTWKAAALEGDARGGWQQHGTRLRLTVPANTAATYSLVCGDALPNSSWTMDFWLVQYDDHPTLSTTITLGPPGHPYEYLKFDYRPSDNRSEVSITRSELEGGGYIYGGAGNIAWIRLVCDPGHQQFCIYLNGQQVALNNKKMLIPSAPVSLNVTARYKMDHEIFFDFAGFAISKEAHPLPASVVGAAWKGWQPVDPWKQVSLPDDLAKRLQAMGAMPNNTGLGRAYALAAQLLAARQGQDQIPADLWAAVTTYLQTALDKDPESASVLLPLVITSGDDAQRKQAAVLVPRFFTGLNAFVPGGVRNRTGVLARAALIDPVQTANEAAVHSWNYNIPLPLLTDLTATAPERALMLECMRLNANNWNMASLGWHLPELQQCSPNYYQLSVNYFTEAIGRKFFHIDEPNRSLSYAAYKMAKLDYPTAITLASGITRPDFRADAVQAVCDESTAAHSADLDAKIESALMDAAAQFTPTARNDSPGPELMRLARWYEKNGRHAQALTTVNQAIKKIGKLTRTTFRDTWAIYLFLRDVKHPDAAAWLDRATTAAIALDMDPESRSPDTVSSAATAVVVRELAKAGQVEQALSIARKLNIPDLPDNYYSGALAAIFFAIGDADTPRAMTLLKEITEVHQRSSCVAWLAKKLAARDTKTALALFDQVQEDKEKAAVIDALVPEVAKTDLPTALALAMKVAPANRAAPLIRIAAVTPAGKSPQLQQLCGEAVAAKFAEYRARPSDGRDYLLAQLATLPLPMLLALSPYFSDEPEVLSHLAFLAVGTACSLNDEPVWQRMLWAETPRPEKEYWGCTLLRDALSNLKYDQGK